MKKMLISLIKAYQKTISPDHSKIGKFFYPHGCCRFHPTCSDYTIQAIDKYGVIKGSYLGSLRVLRCNPFSSGGIDPVK